MSSNEKPKPEVGVIRIWKAVFYSLSGFKYALKDEAAFRQELLFVIVLTAVCLLLPFEPWLKTIILCSHILILIVELANTAIESVVDMVSPNFDENAKKAKDAGSAAVLLSILLTTGLWVYALLVTF